MVVIKFTERRWWQHN